ncbi:adaptin N terminal region-domain-containing protein [Phycomyces nitens]|nr:adaptin N terminal region-domain-containing protein [Phycomyces nitens]
MFEKSLTDLIRGIRANKKNEQKYIAVCLQEIRNEVKANDTDIKAMAIAKLTYLQMLGYDMSWASFHIVEVMSSPKILQKRAGYLAAAQSFQQDTDVLMLTTNLIKKDLASPTALEIGIAINGLSQIVTPDLARDLCQDLVAMLNHSRPYIRKKVVLVLYKVFLKFPEALRLSFPRVKEKLEDPDPSVVSAVVSVVCELARKNPRNYLSLAPQLYKLLTTSSNNWMLIKIIKLFASLTPLEPRLIKKLLHPLTSLIQTTPATSLLYECIYTVISGGFLEAAGDSSHALAATCTNKLRRFLEDPDQNLKYVGLLAMGKMLSTHPKLVAEHKDIILECIDDDDLSIRLRALDLVVGMVNKKNVMDIVKRLVSHLVPPSESMSGTESSAVLDPVYRTDIINRILFVCSQNQYHNITNFEWYINILVGITYASGVNVGESLTSQLMDVSVRVKSVRPFAVKQMYRLLSDKEFLETVKKRESNIEVLSAAAWICGEYCSFLDDVPSTLECLLTPTAAKLPVKVQSIYVHNIMKIYAFWVTELIRQWDDEVQTEFLKVTRVLRDKIDMFAQSLDLEVQERSGNAKVIFTLILDTVGSANTGSVYPPLVLQGLPELFFIYELNPVAPKAQKKVPVPEGLDLDAWICEPLPELVADHDSDSMSVDTNFDSTHRSKSKKKSKNTKQYESEDDEAVSKRRNARLEAHRNDPYYILGGNSEKKRPALLEVDDDVESIPIVELSLDNFDFSTKSKKKSGKKKGGRALTPPPMPVYAEEEMPENAAESGSEEESKKNRATYTKKSSRDIFASDDNGLNNVDLSTPLGDDEKFPQIKTYGSPEEARRREEARVKAARKEQRAMAEGKAKGESQKATKKTTKEGTKKSKKTSEKKTSEKKGKKAKKSEKVQSPTQEEFSSAKVEEVPYAALADDMRDALAEHKEQRVAVQHELLSNEHVEVIYTLHLEDKKVDGEPVVAIKFSIENKAASVMLPKLHLEFIQSFDMKLLEDEQESGIASVSETFELQVGEKVDCVGIFAIQGNARRGLCLRGDLHYDVEGSSTLNQHPLEISLPVSLFIKNEPTIDPTQFSTLLAEHGDEFDYHGNVTMEIPITPNASVEQALIHALESVTHTTGLQVVEVVPGAASLYGQSVQNVQVAGLLKYILGTENDVQAATMTIDLKCTDDDFLEGLIHELSSIKMPVA